MANVKLNVLTKYFGFKNDFDFGVIRPILNLCILTILTVTEMSPLRQPINNMNNAMINEFGVILDNIRRNKYGKST